MKLEDVQRAIVARQIAQSITGIAYDSRAVRTGNVFVALRGVHADGVRFVQQAAERGAVAVVAEQPIADLDVPVLQVGDARLALAELAADFYGHPSERLRVVGVTGTNGKTTTAHLIASIFDAAGMTSGIIGTVAHRIVGQVRESLHTTPEAPDVQALLREMVDRGCVACAMEASSHALALRRVDAMTFSAGVFTNLTRDHLDFHETMEGYFLAKRRLFEMLPAGAPALINADDPRAAAVVAASSKPVTYAINRPADITPGPLSFSIEGLDFDIRTPRGALRARSKLVGRPNVYNILAAAGTGVALGLPFDAIERGVQSLQAVPGRFEVVSNPSDSITVVVDYAHTDDALRNLLETARPLARGRLITLFGAGGERDRTKRPLMGAVASRLSDVLVITSDNPRHEDPVRIIEEIQRGITPDTRRGDALLFAIPDRRTAIAKAIEVARPGDMVLLAGKGHEKYQIVGDEHVPLDDVAIARDLLGRRQTNSGVM
ncbi:MAG TPA: UDP-N-acetylmuramoyl-L-alanyl-D-glutamate--2,6-diaminopimelate ligase [Vicinamibacterales bacterium]|nr:UDP-N-acetylmuramoyl-L-alanyl-D-glutamate--2,6-diaminopimelate ligase [Vicinamibacterales bacterium]